MHGAQQDRPPGHGLDADGQVDRRLVERSGVMDIPARDVDTVAGIKIKLMLGRGGVPRFVGLRVRLMRGGQSSRRIEDAPPLRTRDLEYEDVMSVVVRA